MQKEYYGIALKDYIDSLPTLTYLTVDENEVNWRVRKYLLNIVRYNTNSKIVESLLA